MTKVVVAHNYVVARVDQNLEHETGRHNIVVPTREKAFKVLGTVVGVGPMCRIKIDVGDRILFPPYGAGEFHTVDGIEYVWMLDWEVLGTWRAS